MSLIKCQECGKEISDKAESCPNCGNKYINKKNSNYSSQIRTGSIVSLIANSLLIVLVIAFFAMGFDITYTPKNGECTDLQVSLIPETGISLICFLLSLLLVIVNFILVIIFLSKKIKNIKLYKWLLLLFSIIQLICTFISIAQICCGIVYCIFPIINFIGAIIVVTGKVK